MKSKFNVIEKNTLGLTGLLIVEIITIDNYFLCFMWTCESRMYSELLEIVRRDTYKLYFFNFLMQISEVSATEEMLYIFYRVAL